MEALRLCLNGHGPNDIIIDELLPLVPLLGHLHLHGNSHPISDQMSDIYADGTYISNNPSWHVEHSAWKAAQVAGLLSANGVSPESLCEVGCGAGEVLSQLSLILTECKRLEGYETSPQAYKLCLERQGGRLNYFNEDLLASRRFFGIYDVLLCIDVLEHVEDYMGFLRRLRPKARWFVFHIPLDLSAQSVLRPGWLLEERRKVGHLHFFNREVALSALSEAGYEVRDWRYTPVALEFPSHTWRNTLALLPRRLLFWLSPELAIRLLGGWSLLVLAVPAAPSQPPGLDVTIAR